MITWTEERKKEWFKEYYRKNKEKLKTYFHDYYSKKETKKKRKAYFDEKKTKESYAERLDRLDKMKKYLREYRAKNKEKFREYARQKEIRKAQKLIDKCIAFADSQIAGKNKRLLRREYIENTEGFF